MSYSALFLLLAIATCFISLKIGEKANKKFKVTLTVLSMFFWVMPLLPKLFFGKWDAISALRNKEIFQIRLRPSLPNWKVNLVGHDLVISDRQQIKTIIRMLNRSDVYFPSHPIRVWETTMILVTTTRDTFEMQINKTTNEYNGTYIQTPSNEWRSDALGSYLEKITNYHQPVYSDTAKREPVNLGSQ